MTRLQQRRHQTNGGFVLAMVLVCLTVIVLALTAMLGRMSQGHRQAVQREQYVQAEWLAESGFERAAARLRQDSAYRGEQWRIDAAELGGRRAADVVIEIEIPESQSSGTVRVIVHYPDPQTQAIQKEKQLTVSVPEKGETP